MKKNYLLVLLLAATCVFTKSVAQTTQPCGTDEMRRKLIAKHPEILQREAEFERQVKEGIKKIDLNKYGRVAADQTGNDSFWYDIPIVIHVIHDYNNSGPVNSGNFRLGDYVLDDSIYDYLKDWNIVYAGANADISSVIPNFIPYIGIPRIRLHLATIDPNGNPTHGITRRRSYLTYNGGEQSKFDQWAPSSYVNIWTDNNMGSGNAVAAAYALQPAGAASDPQGDGIICLYEYLGNVYSGYPAVSKTINHEMGHIFNLQHPWGNTNNPEVACGDDLVDDTPPTHGHNEQGCLYDHTALYDTDCATNYFKIYATADSNVESLVNYPDTVNAQNIMDYTYCSRMFTKGQVKRMDDALNSNVANRNNLWDSTNLANTGVTYPDPANPGSVLFVPRLDLKPIPEYNATIISSTTYGLPTTYQNRLNYFTFPGVPVKFVNETWNDTLVNLTWTFSNNAATPVSTSTSSFNNSFSLPGWVSMTMSATGNNSGDTAVVFPNAVFVANTTGTPADGYFAEFSPSGDLGSWPMFNYYNNEFKWQPANVGYYDNSSVEYTGYDNRVIPAYGTVPYTGNPGGDVDDLFSIPMDLSAFTDTCNLNFFYSGASRSSVDANINDTLEIAYSVNKSPTWTTLTQLTGYSIDNKGALAIPYQPGWQGDWAPMTVGIPAALRTNYVTFRFRYRPGETAPDVNGDSYSSGNNFYMDRVNFSRIPASASNIKLTNMDVVLAPNPTDGDAYVIIKDAYNATAKIVVTDITGKVVFTTEQQVSGGNARIQIPHSAIAVKGVYLVQTSTGSQVHTQKLIVD